MTGKSTKCLNCNTLRSTVNSIRRKEGYTIGCGFLGVSENGTEFDEISPTHRWAPWTDRDLSDMSIKPELFDQYRMKAAFDVLYAPCSDNTRGHQFVSDGINADTDVCWNCGATQAANASRG